MKSVFKNVAIICWQDSVDIHKTLSKLIKHLQRKKINIVLEQDTAKVLANTQLPAIPSKKLNKHCEFNNKTFLQIKNK